MFSYPPGFFENFGGLRIWQNPPIPPDVQEARAATIPSGVIVAWPSTAELIPLGWSRVIALDATYVRGVPNGSTNPGTTGGTTTHQHTTSAHDHTISHTHATATSGNATGSVTAGTTSSLDLQTTTHTHATNAIAATINNSGTSAPSSGNASNDPAYLKVIWIESNGTPTGIPDGALAMFSTTSLPGSWAIYANSQDKFLKGADALGDGGATGGAATHNHTGEGSHTHTSDHVHPDGTTAQSASTNNSYATGATACGDNHTHTYTVSSNNFGTSNAATLNTSTDNHEPPWQKVAIIENQTEGDSAPVGIIAVWRGTLANIPAGWVLADGSNGTPNLLGDFVKGVANTGEIGNIGGTTSHTHTGSNHTHTWASTAHTHTVNITGPCSVPRGTAGTTATWASPTHTHTVTSGAASAITPGNAAPNLDSATHLPPYEEVAYIMFNGFVDTPVYDNGTATYNNDVSVVITVASPADSVICYTTNGDTPAATTPGTCSTGTTYSGAVSITATGTVLKAIGTKAGYANSSVQSATYTLQVANPSFDTNGGSYNNDTPSTQTSTTTSAVFCYTLDGNTPAATTAGTCDSDGHTQTGATATVIATGTTIKVLGTKANYANSSVQTSNAFTLTVGAITSIPGEGTYGSTQSVSLSIDTTLDAVAHYTTDGGAVTCSSTTYSGAFNVAKTTTVKAIGCKTNYVSDTAISDLYTISLSTAIEIRAQNYTTNVTNITFPADTPSAEISLPTNGVGAEVQTFGGAGTAKPVVTLVNSGTKLNIWYNISTWSPANVVASEKYIILAKGAACASANAITNTAVIGTDTKDADNTQIGSDAPGENPTQKDLYLKITLDASAGKTGTSTLSVLGETP
jgi:hypothetical protein